MKKWQFWLGVLISVLFIGLALRGLRLDEFWSTVQSANYWWLLPGIAVYFVAVWVRAWRWHYLLGPVKKIPTKTMFPITTIGYMGNNIYPARAGEVLRAVILKRREGVSISASLATIIVERIFDGVVMLAEIELDAARSPGPAQGDLAEFQDMVPVEELSARSLFGGPPDLAASLGQDGDFDVRVFQADDRPRLLDRIRREPVEDEIGIEPSPLASHRRPGKDRDRVRVGEGIGPDGLGFFLDPCPSGYGGDTTGHPGEEGRGQTCDGDECGEWGFLRSGSRHGKPPSCRFLRLPLISGRRRFVIANH